MGRSSTEAEVDFEVPAGAFDCPATSEGERLAAVKIVPYHPGSAAIGWSNLEVDLVIAVFESQPLAVAIVLEIILPCEHAATKPLFF